MVALGVDATVSEVHSDLSGTSFLYESETRAPLALRTRLPGSHQADNAGLALLMLDAAGVALSDEDVAKGVARGVVPGRFEVRTTPAGTYVLDAAHNPAAVTALAETLRDVEPPGPVIAVVGVLSDKDWAPMLDRLAVDVDHVILTRPSSAPAARTWDPDAVAAGVSRERASHVTVCAEMVEALSEARARAGEGTVLVTGSSHTVGEAKGVLGPGGERPGA